MNNSLLVYFLVLMSSLHPVVKWEGICMGRTCDSAMVKEVSVIAEGVSSMKRVARAGSNLRRPWCVPPVGIAMLETQIRYPSDVLHGWGEQPQLPQPTWDAQQRVV